MKERILSRWTVARILYLVIGIYVIVQSIMDKQWMGVAVGGYFAAMGLFAFGCAAGNCFVATREEAPMHKLEITGTEVGFEEAKTE
ncbi:MAG: hypothetical protein ACHQFX_14120 [Chitinophagales bacterium]